MRFDKEEFYFLDKNKVTKSDTNRYQAIKYNTFNIVDIDIKNSKYS